MSLDEARAAIAAEVRAELARQGKTQRDVAAALGIDQPNISPRMRGERSFRAEELALLAAWLRVPIGNLIPVPVPVGAA